MDKNYHKEWTDQLRNKLKALENVVGTKNREDAVLSILNLIFINKCKISCDQGRVLLSVATEKYNKLLGEAFEEGDVQWINRLQSIGI